MKENHVIITEKDGSYQLENNGISKFALLGILECIVFEMKTAERRAPDAKEQPPTETPAAPQTATESAPTQKVTTTEAAEKSPEKTPEKSPEKIAEKSPEKTIEATATKSNSPDLRTRIGNAVKAIKSLGGNVPKFEVETATDEELQEELSVLTEQYKRLKSSQTAKK